MEEWTERPLYELLAHIRAILECSRMPTSTYFGIEKAVKDFVYDKDKEHNVASYYAKTNSYGRGYTDAEKEHKKELVKLYRKWLKAFNGGCGEDFTKYGIGGEYKFGSRMRKSQQEKYERLLAFCKNNNYKDMTFREIGKKVDMKHPQSVKYYLIRLRSLGLID